MKLRMSLYALLAVLAALVVAGCGGSVGDDEESGGGSDDTLTVGLVIPQSGVYAPLGEDMKAGWDLFLAEHGDKIGGREVETVVADEGETPDTGVPAVQKMLQDGEVDVIAGIVNSAVALGAADAVEQSEKVLIVANAGANEITTADNPYIWRTSFTNGQVGFATGTFAAEGAGGQDAALIAPDYAAGAEQGAGLKAGFEEGGGTVVAEIAPPFGTTQDYQPFLGEIERSGADSTLAFFAGAEAVGFVQQYAEFGLKGKQPLFGTGFLTEGGVLAAQGGAAEGTRTALHYVADLDNPANQEFADAYSAAAKRPPTVYAMQMWDVGLVLDQALGGAGSTSGDDLSKALEGLGEISDSPRGPWSFEDKSPKQKFYGRQVEGEANTQVKDLGEFSPSDGA